MQFRYWPTRLHDLKSCLQQARDFFAYAPSDHADIVAMWMDLLARGSAMSMVIEECDTGSMAFFVLMVFVTDGFAVRLAAGDVPPLTSGYWLDAWRAERLPTLTREQVRTANSSTGVTLF